MEGCMRDGGALLSSTRRGHGGGARGGRIRGGGGGARARLHYRFAPPLIHFIPDSLTYSVPLCLRRQCDRTLLSLCTTAHPLHTRFANISGAFMAV
jgi:hypothetical protein